ncbi:MAG: OmpA family protein [Pseudomonadota bacterium]
MKSIPYLPAILLSTVAVVLCAASPSGAGCTDEKFMEAEKIYEKALKEESPLERIKLLEKAFEICPSHGAHARGYYMLGKLYAEKNDAKKALEWLLEANRFRAVMLQRAPKIVADANLRLGRIFQSQGDEQAAMRHLNVYRALIDYPDEKLERELLENSRAVLDVIYEPGTVKDALTPVNFLSPDQRSKLGGLKIYFDSASTSLAPSARKNLDVVGNELKDGPFAGCLIVVEGHTDTKGSKQYNCRLGEKRAQAAADYLQRKWNFADSTILALGRGFQVPAMERRNDAEDQWPTVDRINRRVVIWNYGPVNNAEKAEVIRQIRLGSQCAE